MKLDLSNFFKDERRQSLVFIDTNWQNIKDVQDHIQNLFKLKDINLLTTDGCFLPPRESIQVLKEVEGLTAFRFSDPGQNDFSSPAPGAKNSKKRKYTSAEEEVELPSSTPSRPSKRSKKKSSIAPEIPVETSPDLSMGPFEFPLKSSQNSTKCEKSNEKPSASSVLDHSSSKASSSLQNESTVTAAVDQEAPEDKSAPLREMIDPPTVVFRCPLMELDSNTGRTFELPAKKSSIVIIENIEIKAGNGIDLELEDAANATEKLEETLADVNGDDSVVTEAEKSILLTPTAEPEADTIQEAEADLSNAPDAEISQIEEKVETKDVSQAPVAASAPVRFCAESVSSDSESDVMVLDDTNLDDSDSDVQAVVPAEEPKRTGESNIIHDMLQSAAPLNNLPSRGDTILFKLMKVKGNPALGITDFIAGNCAYINRRSKVLTLEVISCPSEFNLILLQYTNTLDESGGEIRCINVNAKDLIEAKIIVDTID